MSHGMHFSEKQCPFTADEREHMSKVPYASAVGSIMYAMICTRSDMISSLEIVSRYQSDPDEYYWKVVETTLKYLKNTKRSNR